MEIQIHQMDHRIQIDEKQYLELISAISKDIQLEMASCNIVFTNDAQLAQMHADYLDDPSETDVITFNLGEEKVEGEVYISSDRAIAQANEFSVSAEEEVLRLIAHGLLHLKGYNDLNEDDRKRMKSEENRLVDLFSSAIKKK